VSARALRDLGKPNDAAKKDYKLDDKPTNIVTMKDGKKVSTSTITVRFKDGSSRTFNVGGSVYGGSDKYVMDPSSGKAYVFSKDLLSGLEIGESSLHLLDPRGFDANKIASVTIDASGKSKTVERMTTKGGADGNQEVKTWGDPATKKADQTAANFVDNANNLRPTEYASNLEIKDLTPVLKLTYKDDRGALLGTLQLFRREKPGTLPEGQELDPANPPKSETEYYIVTEKTRVPALVRKDTAQRSEQDIETVFSGKQPEPKSAVDPHGNPFGPNAPKPDLHPGAGSAAAPGLPGMGAPGAPGSSIPGAPGPANPHAGMPGMGTPGAPAPGAGSAAAPKAAGSAAASKAPGAPAAGSAAAAPKAPAAPAAGSAAPKAPAPAHATPAAPKPAAPAAPAAGSAAASAH
jgi:VCBS repeat-containing protein